MECCPVFYFKMSGTREQTLWGMTCEKEESKNDKALRQTGKQSHCATPYFVVVCLFVMERNERPTVTCCA